MKRKFGTGLAIMAMTLGSLGVGSAAAGTIGGGNSTDAPGQVRAGSQCSDSIFSGKGQDTAYGKNKNKSDSPANCDHFYQ